jgi:hypothetical protein
MNPIPHALSARATLALAALGIVAAGGCSSSSSGNNPALTARAVSSETFHNVTPRANAILQRSLPLMRGVASDTYQNGDLTVTFRSTADKLDQTNVENVVHQAQRQATAPSSTPTASSSATASPSATK